MLHAPHCALQTTHACTHARSLARTYVRAHARTHARTHARRHAHVCAALSPAPRTHASVSQTQHTILGGVHCCHASPGYREGRAGGASQAGNTPTRHRLGADMDQCVCMCCVYINAYLRSLQTRTEPPAARDEGLLGLKNTTVSSTRLPICRCIDA